jgi:hypothetical protein
MNRVNRRYSDNMPTLKKMRDDLIAKATGLGTAIDWTAFNVNAPTYGTSFAKVAVPLVTVTDGSRAGGVIGHAQSDFNAARLDKNDQPMHYWFKLVNLTAAKGADVSATNTAAAGGLIGFMTTSVNYTFIPPAGTVLVSGEPNLKIKGDGSVLYNEAYNDVAIHANYGAIGIWGGGAIGYMGYVEASYIRTFGTVTFDGQLSTPSGYIHLGGLVGNTAGFRTSATLPDQLNHGCVLRFCSANADVRVLGQATGEAAGFVGYASYTKFFDCTASGDASNPNQIQGTNSAQPNSGVFFGYANGTVTSFENCFVTARAKINERATGSVVQAFSYAGGFGGRLESSGVMQGNNGFKLNMSYDPTGAGHDADGYVTLGSDQPLTVKGQYAGGMFGSLAGIVSDGSYIGGTSSANLIVPASITVFGSYRTGGFAAETTGCTVKWVETHAQINTTDMRTNGDYYVGGFVAYAGTVGQFISCFVGAPGAHMTISVKDRNTNGWYIGGFVAYMAFTENSETVKNFDGCVAYADLFADHAAYVLAGSYNGTEILGGFIGHADNGNIYNSKAYGNVTLLNAGEIGNTGGFVGRMYQAKSADIVSCEAYGNVTSISLVRADNGNSNLGYAGGFAGNITGSDYIYNSKSAGSVTGVGNRFGGFVGNLAAGYNTVISQCEATGDVRAPGYVLYAGGFVGLVGSETVGVYNRIVGSVSRGDVFIEASGAGDQFVGGFAGRLYNNARLSDDVSFGTLHFNASGGATKYVGAFAGYANAWTDSLAKITNSYAFGLAVTGNYVSNTATRIGKFVATNDAASAGRFSDCYYLLAGISAPAAYVFHATYDSVGLPFALLAENMYNGVLNETKVFYDFGIVDPGRAAGNLGSAGHTGLRPVLPGTSTDTFTAFGYENATADVTVTHGTPDAEIVYTKRRLRPRSGSFCSCAALPSRATLCVKATLKTPIACLMRACMCPQGLRPLPRPPRICPPSSKRMRTAASRLPQTSPQASPMTLTARKPTP